MVLLSIRYSRSTRHRFYPVADIIDTYVYRQSFMAGTNFGCSTAIGLLKSVIGVVMICTANKITTKLGEDGLF